MSTIQIKENIYSVGVINPNLRVFDIIMKTDFGTSYNSYLIRDEKTVLIDTVHLKFFDEYLENIRQVCDVAQIDYLIMNHTEPDHSGSLAKLLELNPNLTVISTMPAKMYSEEIANKKFNSQVVKDGETLNTGKYTLKFSAAPFLHWPDSMFTYVEGANLVFTCDFLGAHFCEPRMLDKYMLYEENYKKEFLNYYQAIFGPFKKYVLDGLDILSKMKFDTVCPSHGPVLTERIDEAMQSYRQWSTPEAKDKKKVAIFFVSAYGCTEKLAQAFEKGVQKAGVDVEKHEIIYTDPAVISKALEEADGYMFGSPTINRDALKPVWDVLTSIDAISNRGKAAFTFGSFGWSGEAVKMMNDRLTSIGIKVFNDGMRVKFVPTEENLKEAEKQGEEFAKSL